MARDGDARRATFPDPPGPIRTVRDLDLVASIGYAVLAWWLWLQRGLDGGVGWMCLLLVLVASTYAYIAWLLDRGRPAGRWLQWMLGAPQCVIGFAVTVLTVAAREAPPTYSVLAFGFHAVTLLLLSHHRSARFFQEADTARVARDLADAF